MPDFKAVICAEDLFPVIVATPSAVKSAFDGQCWVMFFYIMSCVEKNGIACYPEILCIVLCRSITNGGRILSSVNFPVENFQPSEYLNDGNDDTTYDLIASVNHHAKPNGGGHYYAICRQNILGRWYKYDDENVAAVVLTRAKGIRTVKIEHQRAATILFYKKEVNQLLR